jgi:hypothetical protein
MGEQAALCVGLSLACIPVAMLWTSTLGLSWSRPAVRAGALILGLVSLAVLIRRHYRRPRASLAGWSARETYLLVVFWASAGVRFIMMRDFAGPAWVDSVHHGLLARLILADGGFPRSFEPYFSMGPADYHLGYHAVLAAFQWLSGLALPEAMLVLGQVLNALSVLAAYALTTRLTQNRSAGLAAGLITGLFTPMPAFYLHWGRYTQLTGLLLLPGPLAWISPKDEAKQRLGATLLGGLTLGGLIIIHYRVTVFALLLLSAYLLVQSPGRKTLRRAGAICLGGILLSAPWLLLLLKGVHRVAPKRPAITLTAITWDYLTPALGTLALGLAGVGLLWGLIQRRRFPLTLILWISGLYLLASLSAGFINQGSVEISLFLPIAVLGGYALSQVMSSLPAARTWPWRVASLAALGAASLFGAQRQLTTLNPSTTLLREADFAAMAWIRENVPPGETILVNSAEWAYGLDRGSDGGYWLSPLTGHTTLPPAALYALNSPESVQAIEGFTSKTRSLGHEPGLLGELLAKRGIRYIYIGERGGPLSSQALEESPRFESLYHHSSTWVFLARP